jgi:hypothetical protein
VTGAFVDRLEIEPRDEAVKGVQARGLAQRDLSLDTGERVATVDEAVRPRGESRATVRGPHLVGVEGHDEVASVEGE